MKRYIAILVTTFLSCNAMVQTISPQLAHEEVTLLGDLNNNQITEESFNSMKSFYSKIAKQDARSAKTFIVMATSVLDRLDDAQYESLGLRKKIAVWLVKKHSQRLKTKAIPKPS